MASSLLLTARCIGKSGFRSHFPCNPEIDVVITKFPLTPTLQSLSCTQHAARFSTCHPSGNYIHAPPPVPEEEGRELSYSALKPKRSKRKLQPDNVGPPSPEYPVTSLLARKILKDHWGYPGFRLEQEAVISRLIAGGSASVVFPTGSGKSLLYQVPALAFDQLDENAKPGVTLVISPLIALMKDQTEDLVARGIKAASINSSIDGKSASEIYSLLQNNELKLLYCSPERLINEKFVDQMRQTRIHMVAIDEVHCAPEWGNTFRPDYLKVANFIKEIGVERVLCLTATSTPKVTANICSIFGIPEDGLFRAPTYRPNLQLLARSFKYKFDKLEYLILALTENPGASIVYVTFRYQTKYIADILDEAGIEALPYHAGMSQSSRAEVQERFMKSDNITIVATIAFGLGINKPDIRNVIHFDCPRSLEQYSQEIGRAGRDGKLSKGILFLCSGDNRSREILRLSGTPSKSNIRKFYQQLFERYGTAQVGDVIESDRNAECEEFDTTKSSAIAVLYSKLEIRFGLLRGIAPKYSSRYTYRLSRGSLSEEDTSDLAQTIIKISKGIKKPGDLELLSIDIDEVATALEIDRRQVLSKLREWNDSQMIDLGSPDGISRYRVIKQFPQTKLAVQEVIETTYNELKAQDAETVERTGKVIKLITGNSCYARGLAAHFEDINSVPKKGCGHCQWCLTKKRVRLWGDNLKSKNKGRLDAERINTVLAACPDRSDPELLAKIAIGVKSPKILREGYGPRNEVFGSMADCSFDDLVDKFQAFCDDGDGDDDDDNDDEDDDDDDFGGINSR